MIDFGDTLELLEKENSKKKKRPNRYNGSLFYQEAKDDDEIKEKYDDKYDDDDRPDTEIEDVDVDVDDEDYEDEEKELDKESDKDDDDEDDDKKKKKSKKKKDKDKEKDKDDDSDDEESDDDDEDESDEKEDEKEEDDDDDDDVDFEGESVGDPPGVNNHKDTVYGESATRIQASKKLEEYKKTSDAENKYYSSIADSAKDLEHLYKELMHRMDKEQVVEELESIFGDLKNMRHDFFEKQDEDEVMHSSHENRSYKGMQRIVEDDITQIEQNIKELKHSKKKNSFLIKKTVKLMNRLQQDMISESERSQHVVIRHARDIAKKLWFFNSFNEDIDDGDTTIMEDVTIIKAEIPASKPSMDDEIFAKVGELMMKLRKQQELQKLAEKNGVQINGMKYTDDTVMNIATAVVALMIAKDEGDPKYRLLVDQGVQKRSLKTELINAYKVRANELINRYEHGSSSVSTISTSLDPIEVEPDVVAEDHDHFGYEEEYYIDPATGELKEYYQEMDESYNQGDGEKSREKRYISEQDLKIEVKPCEKVGDIKFGDTQSKVQKKLEDKYGSPKRGKTDVDDYGKFTVQYENGKCVSVTIVKDIEVELDRSIVFPGKVDNIRKKALDITETNGELVSKIMSVSVKVNSDNTIKTITFARKNYFSDQQFEKYDAIEWHVNNGESEKEAIKRMKEVYKFLNKHGLLTPDGKREMKELDENSVLNSDELTDLGNKFMKQFYNKCKDYSHKQIYQELEHCWEQFNNSSYESKDNIGE